MPSVLFANKIKFVTPCVVILCYTFTLFSTSGVYDKKRQSRRMPHSFIMQQKLSLMLKHNATASSITNHQKPNPKESHGHNNISGALEEQRIASWGVKWVFVVHLSGSQERFEAITKTWAASTPGEEVAFIFFGKHHHNLVALPIDALHQYSTIEAANENEFAFTKAAFSLALHDYPFVEWVAKFDDDTYVYSRELIRQVRSMPASAHYLGYPMKPNPDASFTYASGGAGYVLSRKAASVLHSCTPSDPRYEDLAVGLCMQQASTPLIDLVGLHPNHPFQMLLWNRHGNHPSDRARRMEPVEGFMNPLSYHYVPPEDILRMHSPEHTFASYREKKARGHDAPHILHQFRESHGKGEGDGRPEIYMKKCKETHSNWSHLVWNSRMIRERFPAAGGVRLQYGDERGRLINNEPVRSCCIFAVQVDGMSVVTVEGLAPNRGVLSKLQDAFCEKHALQCGYCTPGMLIACQSLLERNPHPSKDEVRDAISSNLCRCTGYQQVVDAVMYATQTSESSTISSQANSTQSSGNIKHG